MAHLQVAYGAPEGATDVGKGERAKTEKVTINFVDVDISTVVKFISDVTGKNFIHDDKVKGKITIIAPKKLSTKEAFDLFTSVLSLKGFTIVKTENAYKIIPKNMARQSGISITDRDISVNERYVVRLIPLKFISSQAAIPFLKPIVSKDGYISSFGEGNTILIIDTAVNTNKVRDILDNLDKKAADEAEMIYLEHAQAEDVAAILNQGSKRRSPGIRAPQPKGVPGGAITSDSVRIIPDLRLNAILLIGPASEKKQVKYLVTLLDVPSPSTSSRINVYYLENADAESIAGVLQQLINPKPKSGGNKPGGPAQPLKMAEFTGDIAITPDTDTNSLIILASPADYKNLTKVIRQLDRRPKQVFVEAMIVEVSINDALDLGTKWRATAKEGDSPIAIGGVGTVDSTTMSDVLQGMAGFSMGGLANFVTIPVTLPDGTTQDLTSPGFSALFSLAEFEDVVDVLSTPHILTSNNSEAEIIVGENVPFLSSIERESTTTNQPILQSIERKDVGITLRITPQISEKEYVKLDIYQEISSVDPTTQTGGIEASDIITTKRSASTTVVVQDRQTVVIGGLIQEREVVNTSKVPLLGDIPILGWLFKSKKKSKKKTNLIIYLTPTIVDNFADLQNLTRERKVTYRDGIDRSVLSVEGSAEGSAEGE